MHFHQAQILFLQQKKLFWQGKRHPPVPHVQNGCSELIYAQDFQKNWHKDTHHQVTACVGLLKKKSALN